MERREDIQVLAFSRGPMTFFGAPYVSDIDNLPEGTKIAVLGVPFDEGVVNRPGTRFGPRGVRSAIYRHRPERGFYDIETGQKFLANVLMVDAGDVRVSPTRSDLTYESITSTVTALLDRGLFPVCVGGDHAVSFPIIRAFASKGPINVVQLDTHMDYADVIAGARYGHGSPMRRSSELENVRHISHFGIRGFLNGYEAQQEALANGNIVVTARNFREMGPLNAAKAVPAGSCYLTLDIDVFDPSIAPGTGTPELGGLYYNEVKAFLTSLASRPDVKLVGFDVVEVNPLYDPAGVTCQLAARVILDLLGTLYPGE